MHLKIYIGEKSYQYKHSNKAFSQKSNLKMDLKVHTGEKP